MRNEGDDMELNSWMILEHVGGLKPWREEEMLLMTARSAG